MYNLGVWVEINIAEMADNLILNDSSTEIEVEFVSEEELILFDMLVNEAQNEAGEILFEVSVGFNAVSLTRIQSVQPNLPL